MHSPDTTLGGGGRDFPRTTLGFLGALRSPEAADYARALEDLARRYWKPVYAYVRVGRAHSNEDAKDLTQAFFAWLLESGVLRRYDPARGGFRAYLRTLLANFVRRQERDVARLKRGGGIRILPLDEVAAGPPEAGPETDPERAFERAWMEDLVREALGRVRRRWEESGRGLRFRAYEEYALVPEARRPTCAELAARLGLAPGEIEKSIYCVREDLRRELRAALAEMAGDDRELEDEWRKLLGL
ncbi:MAG: RNA polymerase sigma factor [Planctomycetota bacterium]